MICMGSEEGGDLATKLWDGEVWQHQKEPDIPVWNSSLLKNHGEDHCNKTDRGYLTAPFCA